MQYPDAGKNLHRYLVNIKDLLPIITILLILIGYWDLDTYYGYFDIDIYNYVSTSEILLSFAASLKELIIVLLGAGIWGLVFLYIFYGMYEVDAEREKLESQLSEDEKKRIKDEKFLKHFSLNPFVIIIYILGLNATNFTSIPQLNKLYKSNRRIYGLVSFGILALIIWRLYVIIGYFQDCTLLYQNIVQVQVEITVLYIIIIVVIYKVFNKALIEFTAYKDLIISLTRAPIHIKLIVLITLSILPMIRTKNYLLAEIIHSKVKYVNTLIYKGKEVEACTTDNIIYIGQTKEYIFLKDMANDMNIIYRLNDVDKIEMKNIIQRKPMKPTHPMKRTGLYNSINSKQHIVSAPPL